MSAVDTIVILNGLQFQKETTSDVYTIDAAGSENEAVKSYAILCPGDASSVRVVFNNNYEASPMRQHIRVKLTKVTSYASGVPTKTENTQLLEWTLLPAWAAGDPAAGIVEIEGDVSAANVATLHIDCAISEAGAHTGTEVICQFRKEGTIEEWTTFAQFIGPTGTAVKSDFAAQEAAAQTTLSITNPTAGGLDWPGKFIFLEDTATIAQCEIAYLTDFGADA